jgi:hypothetical protein
MCLDILLTIAKLCCLVVKGTSVPDSGPAQNISKTMLGNQLM